MIGEKILGRYLVLEHLGGGGMGEVYKAHDERLRCDVALKFLPETHRFDEAARARFLQEARALARTNHPNICNVRDFVDHQGTDVLVMEFVDGVSLNRRLAEGPLEESEVVRLGIQLAEGLGAAHQAGVLHRDLKPGNLGMTRDGRLKILDFGLAKMTVGSEDSTLSFSTSDELTVKGTLPYIAPEVLQGGKPDPRSDLFSAGCVLYEMVTARRAFPQTESVPLWHAIMNLDPTPPREIRPQLSTELEQVVVRCLVKDPAQRYGSMMELAQALRQIQRLGPLPLLPHWVQKSAAIAAVAVGALLLLWVVPWTRNLIRQLWAPIVSPIQSLAVLPFENLSKDAGQEYVADGMTDEMITILQQISSLRVPSWSSVKRFKGTRDPRRAMRELRVQALMEGSVLHSAGRVRVNARVFDPKIDHQILAARYEEEAKDILAMQHRIAIDVTRKIQAKLTPWEAQRLARAAPVDTAAYRLCLRGRYFLDRRSPEAIEAGLESFQEALARDSTFAPAHAGVADAYILLASYGQWPASQAMPLAREAAERAIRIDPGFSEGHAALGVILQDYFWDWTGAAREFRLALQLSPGDPSALLRLAQHQMALGRTDSALALAREAASRDPLSTAVNKEYGTLLLWAGRKSEALVQLRSTAQLDPNSPERHVELGTAYWASGKGDSAAALFEEALRLSGATTEEVAELHRAYVTSGMRGIWQSWLQAKQREKAANLYVPSFAFAVLHARLGNDEEALRWLAQACDEKESAVLSMGLDGSFASLRNNQRFQTLMRRVGLHQAAG